MRKNVRAPFLFNPMNSPPRSRPNPLDSAQWGRTMRRPAHQPKRGAGIMTGRRGNPLATFCSKLRPAQSRASCRSVRVWAPAVLLALVAWTPVRAQQQASISGVVRDPSGAVIPGTTIRVTNLNTRVTLPAETNATGYYVVGNLTPGTYTIAAQKEGFKTATRSDVTLEVAQSATVDFQLELGQTAQAISVQG